MVVAGQGQHPAEGRRARVVGVLEGVPRAVDAGALAVPHGEHAVVFGARIEPDLLAAPDRRGGQVLVDPGLEMDVVLGGEALGAPQLEIERPEGRAAVAADEPGGIQPGGDIAPALHERQPHQGLSAGEIHPPGLEGIFIVETDRRQRHRMILLYHWI